MDFGDLIPVVAILAGLGFTWIAYKNRELMVTSRRSAEEAERYALEKRQLGKRLAVLEKIVTDRGIQTADQIEALREGEQLR